MTENIQLVGKKHPLRSDKIYETFPEGITLYDMLKFTGFYPEKQNLLVYIEDSLIKEKYWDIVRPKEGTLINVKAIPQSSTDEDRQKTIRTVAMIGVAAAAPWAAGHVAGWVNMAGNKLFTGLLSAGIHAAGMWAIDEIWPMPEQPEPPDRPEIKPQITGTRNQKNIGGIIPRVYGKHRMYPTLIADQVSEYQGDDQYINMLMTCGYGPLDLSEFKIGETPLEEYSDYELEYVEGWENEELDEFPTSIRQEQVDRTIIDEWILEVTQRDTDKVSIDIVFPQGLGEIDDEGDIRGETVHIEGQIREVGESNWEYFFSDYVNENELSRFSRGYRKILDKKSQWEVRVRRKEEESDDSDIYDSVVWDTLSSITDEDPVQTDANINKIYLRIRASDQLSGMLDSFNCVAHSYLPYYEENEWKGIDIEKSVMTGVEPQNIEDLNNGDYILIKFVRFKDETKEIKIEFSGEEVSSVDILNTFNQHLEYPFEAFLIEGNISIEGEKEIEILEIDFSGEFNIGFSVGDKAEGYGPKLESNPSSIYLQSLIGEEMKYDLSTTKICFDSLSEWYEFCEEKDFKCNLIQETERTFYEFLNDIASAGRASRNIVDGKFGVIIDKERKIPVQHITEKNSNNFMASKSFIETPDCIKINFLNEEHGWEEDEIFIYKDEENPSRDKVEEFDFTGMTNPKQVYKMGRYHLAKTELRPETFQVDMDASHLVCNRGDLVKLSHDVILVGLDSGYVKEPIVNNNEIIGVIVDETLNFDYDIDYALRIRLSKHRGESVLKEIDNPAEEPNFESTNEIYFVEPINIKNYIIKNDDLYTFGEKGKVTEDVIVKNIEPTANFEAKLKFCNYDKKLYDLDDKPIPEFDTNITIPEELRPPVIKEIESWFGVMGRSSDHTPQPRVKVTLDHISLSGGWGKKWGSYWSQKQTNVFEQLFDRIEAQYKRSSSDLWTDWFPVHINGKSFFIDDLIPEEEYDIRVRGVTDLNRATPWDEKTHKLTGDKIIPNPPLSFELEQGSGRFVKIKFEESTYKKVSQYLFYRSDGQDFENAELIGEDSDSPFIDSVELDYNLEYFYWIKSRDVAGNESEPIGPESIYIEEISDLEVSGSPPLKPEKPEFVESNFYFSGDASGRSDITVEVPPIKKIEYIESTILNVTENGFIIYDSEFSLEKLKVGYHIEVKDNHEDNDGIYEIIDKINGSEEIEIHTEPKPENYDIGEQGIVKWNEEDYANTKYQNLIKRRTVEEKEWNIVEQEVNDDYVEVRIDDLTPEEEYEIGIRGFSAFGVPSEISDTITVTAQGDDQAPSRVDEETIRLEQGTGKIVTLSWEPPTDEHGNEYVDLKAYQIERAMAEDNDELPSVEADDKEEGWERLTSSQGVTTFSEAIIYIDGNGEKYEFDKYVKYRIRPFDTSGNVAGDNQEHNGWSESEAIFLSRVEDNDADIRKPSKPGFDSETDFEKTDSGYYGPTKEGNYLSYFEFNIPALPPDNPAENTVRARLQKLLFRESDSGDEWRLGESLENETNVTARIGDLHPDIEYEFTLETESAFGTTNKIDKILTETGETKTESEDTVDSLEATRNTDLEVIEVTWDEEDSEGNPIKDIESCEIWAGDIDNAEFNNGEIINAKKKGEAGKGSEIFHFDPFIGEFDSEDPSEEGEYRIFNRIIDKSSNKSTQVAQFDLLAQDTWILFNKENDQGLQNWETYTDEISPPSTANANVSSGEPLYGYVNTDSAVSYGDAIAKVYNSHYIDFGDWTDIEVNLEYYCDIGTEIDGGSFRVYISESSGEGNTDVAIFSDGEGTYGGDGGYYSGEGTFNWSIPENINGYLYFDVWSYSPHSYNELEFKVNYVELKQ